MTMRIGQGFDVHRWTEGRPLMLGGVLIPHTQGLLGHSDADVLLHAIMDALLGGAGLGDIGHHFPDTDPRYRGIDSRELLKMVQQTLSKAQWGVANLDATVICERPKLAPYMPAMQQEIARILQIQPTQVNIKATTTEGLGFTGRNEGVAAQAVVLLTPITAAPCAAENPDCAVDGPG
ncbi:MAG: 2-C-methyl-D-erythritol 2,4-cyclodiphosphate synthase [Magnetococcus sp. MYC-9]